MTTQSRQSSRHSTSVITLVLLVFTISSALAQTPILTESAKIQSGEESLLGLFGFSVSIDGNTALVGDPRDNVTFDVSGSVYVFTRDAAGNWTKHTRLNAADAGFADNFGHRVVLDGDTALITAPFDDDRGTDAGSAYIFTRDAAGNWTQQAKLLAPDGAAEDRLGEWAALSGDSALLGTGWDDERSGSAYVFTRDPSGNWTLQAKLRASDAAAGDFFGFGVGLDGNTAVIGAVLEDQKANNAGAAYVFVRDDAGTWTQQAKLVAADGAADQLFGRDISIHGNTALIGAINASANHITGGAVYVFVRNSAGQWTQQAKLTSLDGGDDDFGNSLDLEGDTAVVGAWTHSHDESLTGAAYVFTRDQFGTWSEQKELLASDRSRSMLLSSPGGGVSVSGSTVIAGASFLGNGVPGAAYIFQLTPDDDAPPAISGVFAVPYLVAVNSNAQLTATVDDSATGNSAIKSAEFNIDGGLYTAMAANDGDFDSATEVVTAAPPNFAEAGVYDVCVRGTDEPGNLSNPTTDPENACTFVVAYDPIAGFVTGGGWLYSAEDSCYYDAVCAEASGKANFGFVSRYKKGATVPTGSTEFQFSAGGLNFHSEIYEWLVVNMNGTNAQYKGSGTVNGNLGPAGEEYKFMLWARDLGSSGIDTFRIKIWYVDAGTEVVVYDNGFDQEIGGGNIVIHTN